MRMKFIEAGKDYKKYSLGPYTLLIFDAGKDFTIYKSESVGIYIPEIFYRYGALYISQEKVFVTARYARKVLEGYQEALEVIEFVTERFLK